MVHGLQTSAFTSTNRVQSLLAVLAYFWNSELHQDPNRGLPRIGIIVVPCEGRNNKACARLYGEALAAIADSNNNCVAARAFSQIPQVPIVKSWLDRRG